ncbi:MAG: hypothetical protein ABIK28_03900 [Planctomycetota bacterium]
MNAEQAAQYWNRLREGVNLSYNQSSVTVMGVAVLLILGAFMFGLPRRYSVIPMVILACFTPMGERIVVAGLDFTFLRIMVVIGWARIVLRREASHFVWKPIDTFVTLWAISAALIYIIFNKGAPNAVIFKLGATFDILGIYFLFRVLIKSFDDTYRIVNAFVILSVPVAFIFLIEHQTGRNLFSFMGGVPEITQIRNGRLRCQGAFVHPIAAGCFWASLIPLIASLWWYGGTRAMKNRLMAVTGIVASLLIVYFCSSSTPVGAVVAGVFAACFFPARHFMKHIVVCTCIVLTGLHFAMNGPVWQLIARVDFVGGSTAYHRYQLIDQAINRIDEWWLLGCATTAHWGHFLFDVANTYIYQAVKGGLLTFVLFIVVIMTGYMSVGMLWRTMEHDRRRLMLCWGLGVSLFIHCTSFIALTYTHQTLMIWLMALAIIGSLSPIRRRAVFKAWT